MRPLKALFLALMIGNSPLALAEGWVTIQAPVAAGETVSGTESPLMKYIAEGKPLALCADESLADQDGQMITYIQIDSLRLVCRMVK